MSFDQLKGIVINKPVGVIGKSLDLRSQMPVGDTGYRDYYSLEEVLTNLTGTSAAHTIEIRKGHFPVFVTVPGETITKVYCFLNGTQDTDLKELFSITDLVNTGGFQVITGQKVINSLIVGQLKGTGPVPTAVAGSAAGAGAILQMEGHGFCFKITIMTGPAPGAAGFEIAVVTLSEALGGKFPYINFAPASSAAAGFPFYFFTNNYKEVTILAKAVMAANTAYVLNITVIDY